MGRRENREAMATELTELTEQVQTLNRCLQACIDYWKQDNDELGYDCFLKSLDQLDTVIDQAELSSAQSHQLGLSLEHLHQCVCKKDFIAMIDCIEFELLAITENLQSVGECV